MRVLIISSTTWDDANSFGNTFSNLFDRMENVEIYNIACRHGVSDNKVVKTSVQLTDRSVLKSIYKFRFDPCREVPTIARADKMNSEISARARKNRHTFSFIIRDAIWKLGRWKKSKTLNKFLKEASPDVIYLPIYSSPYMCDFQEYIVKKLNIPVVGHISDDVYSFPPKQSLIAHAYRKKTRKKVRSLINRCEYLEVFAENMQNEYQKEFSKPCYLIGKGVYPREIEVIRTDVPSANPLRFVYTGNIGDDRYKSLAKIGEKMSEAFKPGDAVLDIYSATPLNSEMSHQLLNSEFIVFHGAIPKNEVRVVQSNADFLVHVEGFSPNAVFSAKMSFSTKIIDYMIMSKPIFAFGPEEVNSISVLKKYNLGLVSSSDEELAFNLSNVSSKNVNYERLTENVKKYLHKNRDISLVQRDIYQRMVKLITK